MVHYAVTHPGKLGDALYTLPICHYLANQSGNPIDFYTSGYCRPLKELFEYQSYINDFIVSKEYVAKRFDMGIQPYHIPVPLGNYSTVFHLGFRTIPNKRLDWFMAESIGIKSSELPEISYEVPKLPHTLVFPYIVLASRGETGFKNLFLDFIELANEHTIIIVQIGATGEFIGDPTLLNKDFTGRNLLDTCQLFTKAQGFVGLMSSQLVLANGFPIPKVAPHNNKSWDMRHIVNSEHNFYPVNPDASKILSMIKNY